MHHTLVPPMTCARSSGLAAIGATYCGAESGFNALISRTPRTVYRPVQVRWAWHNRCSGPVMTDGALRILLVDQNMTRASIVEEGLREAGYTSVDARVMF